MKKFIKFLVLASVLLFAASPAFALQCKTGQSLNSDECWTDVKIQEGYPVLVSRGHVLVVSREAATLAANDGFIARHSVTSADEILLGAAQRAIATGDIGSVLARGRGALRLVDATLGAVATGDSLAVTLGGGALVSRAGSVIEYNSNLHDPSQIVGHSLEAATSDDTEHYAYITIV